MLLVSNVARFPSMKFQGLLYAFVSAMTVSAKTNENLHITLHTSLRLIVTSFQFSTDIVLLNKADGLCFDTVYYPP